MAHPTVKTVKLFLWQTIELHQQYPFECEQSRVINQFTRILGIFRWQTNISQHLDNRYWMTPRLCLSCYERRGCPLENRKWNFTLKNLII
jgi:hypothetical protein